MTRVRGRAESGSRHRVRFVDCPRERGCNEIAGNLKKGARPAKTSTLAAFVGAHFQPAKLDAAAIKALIASLQKAGKIAIAGTNVTYALG